MNQLGSTRSSHARDHLLQTPDSSVRTRLPCLERGEAIIHIAPAAGAQFTQYTVEMEPGGRLNSVGLERVLYLLEGSLTLLSGHATRQLAPSDFAYVPNEVTHSFRAEAPVRATVLERRYTPAATPTVPARGLIIGHTPDLLSQPLLGDDRVQVQSLLPAELDFDFAVNLMTYQPGASLSQVEVHVMEHGLLMLEGGGIYRLGDAWYPVTAGDFLWMAPFCPQWFGALGSTPSKYLIYKDAHRHPLA